MPTTLQIASSTKDSHSGSITMVMQPWNALKRRSASARKRQVRWRAYWEANPQFDLMPLFYVDGYIKVTSGSTCDRITSKAECQEAARKLGLANTVAFEMTNSHWPPYCFFNKGQSLWYNNNANAASKCNKKKVCICKETWGSMDWSLVKSYTMKNNTQFSKHGPNTTGWIWFRNPNECLFNEKSSEVGEM